MPRLVAACVWRVTPELVVALDARFGPPVDAYVNGSQVWLRDDGPNGITLEWRLHPVAEFRGPDGLSPYDLFEEVSATLSAGADPPLPLDRLWDGLEAFAAYGDDVEPGPLAAHCTAALGITPTASGLVDHQRIGDAWERSRRSLSITEALLAELQA